MVNFLLHLLRCELFDPIALKFLNHFSVSNGSLFPLHEKTTNHALRKQLKGRLFLFILYPGKFCIIWRNFGPFSLQFRKILGQLRVIKKNLQRCGMTKVLILLIIKLLLRHIIRSFRWVLYREVITVFELIFDLLVNSLLLLFRTKFHLFSLLSLEQLHLSLLSSSCNCSSYWHF